MLFIVFVIILINCLYSVNYYINTNELFLIIIITHQHALAGRLSRTSCNCYLLLSHPEDDGGVAKGAGDVEGALCLPRNWKRKEKKRKTSREGN